MRFDINHIIEIDLDSCPHDHGTAPCTAVAASGLECFNTYQTCQDTANYSVTPKTYRFSERNNVPVLGAINCIDRIDMAPTETDAKEGLKYLGKITITMSDFTHDDIGIDPYIDTRNYIASDRGTYWGKLLARNPFYPGRELRLIVLKDGVEDEQYTFKIDTISQPDSRGKIRIVAKDPLFLAKDGKAQAPKPTKAVLSAAMDASQLTAVVSSTLEYAVDQVVRVGEEYLKIDAIDSGTNTLTFTQRDLLNNGAEDHDIDDSVQICFVADNERSIDVVKRLLEDYTTVSPAYIPFSEWEAEWDKWLSVHRLTNYISDPTDVTDLISEIQYQTNCKFFWDQRQEKIRMIANTPRLQTEVTIVLDDESSIAQSLTAKIDQKRRISECVYRFNVVDYNEDNDNKNFKNIEQREATGVQGDFGYQTDSIEQINSKWTQSGAAAGQVATRLVSRFKLPPIQVEFFLDYKDKSLRVGDHFFLNSKAVQDEFGNNKLVEMEMESMRYLPDVARYQCKASLFRFDVDELIALYGLSTAPENWTDADSSERLQNAYYADINGELPDGSEGYRYG